MGKARGTLPSTHHISRLRWRSLADADVKHALAAFSEAVAACDADGAQRLSDPDAVQVVHMASGPMPLTNDVYLSLVRAGLHDAVSLLQQTDGQWQIVAMAVEATGG